MTWQKWVLALVVSVAAFWTTQAYLTDEPLAPPVGNKFDQGEYFYFASQYKQAVDAYREALAEGLEEPRAKDAWYKIALSQQRMGNVDQAIRAFEEVRRRYPQSDEANHSGGEIERLKLHHNIQ